MTGNQINYWNFKENQRSNRAKEAETFRSNTEKERETKRSNLAKEHETQRSNREAEQLTKRGQNLGLVGSGFSTLGNLIGKAIK